MKYKPQNIHRWTAIAWFAGMSIHFIWSILQHRHRPPTDEVYAQFLSFQIASFALTHLPYWMGGLLLALFIEFVIFGRKAR
ncbi:hypothetical protein [Rhizobacter sp. P5_C2]